LAFEQLAMLAALHQLPLLPPSLSLSLSLKPGELKEFTGKYLM